MPIENKVQLALQAFREGDYPQAKQRFSRLYEETSSQAIARIYLAQLAVLEGKGAEWIADLEALVRDVPYAHEAHHTLGLCYQQKRLLPQASQAFYQALVLCRLQPPQPSSPRSTPQSTPAPFDRQQAEPLLWLTLATLKQQGVYAFATAGTLLGLERTGQLLDNDKDIDIGIDWLQMTDAIRVLSASGWQEASHSYGLINPRCFKHQATGITLDVCGYGTDTQSGDAISGLWMDHVPFSWNRITYFPTLSLTEKTSPAGEVWHLSDPRAFLAALYGEAWRVPDPYFDTIVCAANLRHYSWLAQCYGYSRLYGEWGKGNTHKALAMLATLRRHKPNDPILADIQTHLSQSLNEHRVLALGYFDLFHQGHLNYLNFAKQQGRVLVVGVAQDAFAQKSKGYAPITAEQDRMALLRALNVVDEVHLVAAPMAQTEAAAQWIASLNVQTVVCGEEWQGSERWNVLAIRLQRDGISVVFAPRTDSVSTTEVKQRIRDKLN
ncbi:adenylyltransferase/cytidyltransferase family protein [Marinomonas sp. A79]|uniref:Adenylyltransferase/cytidyltransferase family protein n=1 Tax=Marinomonas vulgaris TaxID=2823372 RepID=A0ABS5H956_9GAMM|nr:adenylyltransferase/cytidyltransferase family protein [Marinomonas vulgaris]MBR7888218.1 adenylyltransferase/cytidyltransferase family protein [Marinomonas vulgaris]